jgi:tetratricopeptide (TPR) repeat protein
VLPQSALRHALAALLVGCSAFGCTVSGPDASRPKEAESWYRRAQREYQEADFDEAHDSVGKALAIVPEDPEVKLLAAEVALSSLDYAEVLRLLKGVPGTQASRLRGRALWYKGDLEAAADELEALLNDPEVKDEWAKATSKLARRGAGRTPFRLQGAMLGAVEMVHVSQVAPYFVVPLEIDGESALAMITTGSGEVVLDSATRQEPSWVSLRFDRLEIQDVPALTQDLSGTSKELGAPIKAMLGVNLLRRLNATFDFRGRQFVVRSFAPPPPPAATRLELHYARGGGMVVQSALGGEKGPKAALMVDTTLPFPIALDAEGWKKAGIDVASLKPVQGDPQGKLKEGMLPLVRLGAFDIPRVGAVYGVSITDLEKATAVDLDGVIGAGLLYPYRCTFADGGRLLWIEDDAALEKMLAPSGPAPGAGAPGPINQADTPPLAPAAPTAPTPLGAPPKDDKKPAPAAPPAKKKN